MRKTINKERLEGRLYQHSLSLKTVQNQSSANYGKEFITGVIEVAVDEDGLNVIPVHFTYVTEETAKGAKNATFKALKQIIDEDKTWLSHGKDNCFKLRVDTALSLNDFYNQEDVLISTKVNEGGFVTIISNISDDESQRNMFEVDMIMTGVTRIEANPEKNITEDYLVVKGAIFNFRNDLLPLDFIVRHPEGMKYFESLGVTNSEPVYTKVWGKINCNTIVNTVTEESAFGEPIVKTYERKSKEWAITRAAKVPYDFGDEAVLTAADIVKGLQDREIMLAEVKKRSDEYRANANKPATSAQTTAMPTSGVAAVKTGQFNF